MTSREQRRLRRAVVQQKKLAARQTGMRNAASDFPHASHHEPCPSVSNDREPAALPARRTRAEINRANAQRSTVPRTAAGKARFSRSCFKHGLYSEQLVLPHEDAEQLEQLKRDLRHEQQPVNTTEDTLVNELAEHFWRNHRMREWEARACMPEFASEWQAQAGFVSFIQCNMASAERGFHKSLAALKKLQKLRGFVPSNQPEQQGELIAGQSAEHNLDEHNRDAALHSGFVSSDSTSEEDEPLECTPEVAKFLVAIGENFDDLPLQEKFRYLTCTPEKIEFPKTNFLEAQPWRKTA